MQFYPRMSFKRRNSRELIPRVRYFRSHNLYLLFECNNKIYPKSKDQLINFRTIDSLYSLHNAVNIFRRKMHRDYNVKRPSCLDCYLSIIVPFERVVEESHVCIKSLVLEFKVSSGFKISRLLRSAMRMI